MEYKHILFDVLDRVAVVTLNIPQRLNPISIEVELEVLDALRCAEAREDAGVAVITGAGEKAFSAGADIKPYQDMDLAKSLGYLQQLHEAEWAIENLRIPTIAAINGLCLGGGFELALGCTLRFASETARMGLPEVNVGCIPGNGGVQRLGRLIGKGRAMWYLLTGETMGAEEALNLGVVNRVFPQDKLLDESLAFARNVLLNKPPIALWALRKSLNLGLEVDLKTASEMDLQLESLCFATEDFSEGVNAFLEKRSPRFVGR